MCLREMRINKAVRHPYFPDHLASSGKPHHICIFCFIKKTSFSTSEDEAVTLTLFSGAINFTKAASSTQRPIT